MDKVRIGVLAFAVWILPGEAAGQAILVDHNSIPHFDQIPEQYLQAARNLRVLFMDRSVGVNTHGALDCLTAADYQSSAPSCRRDFRWTGSAWELVLRTNNDLASGLVPSYIRFTPNPSRYDRRNWHFFYFADTWQNMSANFIGGLNNRSIPANVWNTNPPELGAAVSINPLDYDVVSFQFSYLNVMDGDTITNFFTRLPGDFDDVYDLEREVSENLTGASPPRVFVYWTTSLARAIGTDVSTNFNEQMRQWCRSNNKILFDFADIMSHDMQGNACYDNRDGVPFTTPNGRDSENYPNDGRNLPAICQEKTTEVDGGHLATAQGVISVAKGFWVTVARIAGWNPAGGSAPAPPANLRVVPD